MKDFEIATTRAIDVLRALDVRVEQGTVGWVAAGSGHPRPNVLAASVNEVGVQGPAKEWHVIQGNNIFSFPEDQEKEARALAKSMSEALDKVFKSQKKSVAKRLGDMLA